jgi:hypothetical protein
VEAGWRMLDLQLDEINVINRMDIGLHERRLREKKRERALKIYMKRTGIQLDCSLPGLYSFANLDETIIVPSDLLDLIKKILKFI